MSITLANRQLVQSNLHQLLQKIMGTAFPLKTAYQWERILRAIEKAHRKFSENYKTMSEAYGKKDETGQLILKDPKTGEFEIEEDKKAAHAEAEQALLNQTVSLGERPVSAESLERLTLTPLEARILEPFIDGLETPHLATAQAG